MASQVKNIPVRFFRFFIGRTSNFSLHGRFVMKSLKKNSRILTEIIFFVLLSAQFNCQNFDYKNPYDPKGKQTIDPPSSLLLQAISESAIKLEWQQSGEFLGFKIERKDSVKGQYRHIVTLAKETTSYTDTTVQLGFTYYFRLISYNANNEASKEASIEHFLRAPSNLNIRQESDVVISLTWKDNSEVERGFKIERKNHPDSVFREIASLPPNTTTHTDTSVMLNFSYFYRLRAFSSHLYSDAITSNITLVFSPPTDLKALQLSDTQIRLNWTDNSNFEKGFKIERKADLSGAFNTLGTVDANVTEFIDTNAKLGSTYFYRVTTFTADNMSNYTELSIQHVLLAPTNLKFILMSPSQLRLDWQDNSNIELGFRIQRKDGEGGAFGAIATVTSNFFLDNNIRQGVKHFYRVTAYTPSEESAFTEANIFVFPSPSNLRMTSISENEIDLRWNDNSTFELGFILERSENQAAYHEITRLPANAVSYLESNLNTNSQYSYKIKAFWDNEESAYSNQINIKSETEWRKLQSSTTKPLLDVYFLDENRGWVVGRYLAHLVTIDGGRSWTYLSGNDGFGSYGQDFYQMAVFQDLRGWVCGSVKGDASVTGHVVGRLRRTSFGLDSWEDLAVTDPNLFTQGGSLFDLFFIDLNTGVAVGDAGAIYRTTDGGTSWSRINSNVDSDIYSVFFRTSSIGWAVGRDGVILKSTNGGRSWSKQSINLPVDLNSVHFITDNNGWVVGSSGTILRTTNGGTNWTAVSSGVVNALAKIYWLDNQTAWIVGGDDRAVILNTTDGGTHWQSKRLDNEYPLYSAYFLNRETGWAVGATGTILKYDMHWIVIP